jgi:hypothetical protein
MAVIEHTLNLLARAGFREGFEENQIDDAFKYFALNLILYNVVKLNYTAFLQKAVVPAYRKMEGVDRFGNRWKPLSEKTIALKKHLNYRYAGAIAINIRTRRLLEALKPGWFRNGVYVPRNSDQIVRVDLENIHFEVAVPYANFVDSKRPIFVANRRLVNEAIQRSLPVLRNYWNRREVIRRTNARVRRERAIQEYNRKKLRDIPPPGPPSSLE